jgi:hypothetical protein
LKSTTAIGTVTKQTYEISTFILAWCATNGIATVVDTCCQPSMRKAAAAKDHSKINFYCKQDDGDVYVITGYSTLDGWWSANNMGGP